MSGSMTCNKPAGGSGSIQTGNNGSGSIGTCGTKGGSGAVQTNPPKQQQQPVQQQDKSQSDSFSKGGGLRAFFAQYGVNLP